MSECTRRHFGHDTTTDEVLEDIDLSGKLALVTCSAQPRVSCRT